MRIYLASAPTDLALKIVNAQVSACKVNKAAWL